MHMADIEPRRGVQGNLLQRSSRQHRVMLKDEPINGLTALRARPSDAGEANERAIPFSAREEGREFPRGIESAFLKLRDDAHPPDTGGRNSNVSVSVSR